MSMRSEIDNLIHELDTEKVAIKQKAFVKLYEILQCRLTDIQKVLDKGAGLDWESLFMSVHYGIRGHAQKMLNANTELQENDTKITNFSKVLIKLCDSPGKQSQGIPSLILVKRVSEMLTDEAGLKYFGKSYIQVLQKHILKPSSNLTTVKLETWREVVSVLFKLMKSKKTKITFLDIVYCTKHVIELGCAFSHLAIDLHTLLPHLEVLLETRTDSRERIELLVIAYHCCRNIAVEYRFEVCRFIETTAKYIHQIFNASLNEESKEVLFKLMDLAVIVHYPSIAANRSSLECVHDKAIWHAQLRNFEYIVDLETRPALKSAYKSSAKQEVNQVFAQFAARLCYLIFWDDSVWDEATDEAGENAPKRPRRLNKLQALIAKATPQSGEFNWKWLNVIAEVVFSYPSALEQDDYQSLLQMLSQCQHTMEHDYQVYAFAKCCFVLLDREECLLLGLNPIIAKLCVDLWHKIAEGAARVCTINNKHSLESHALLQILIHYHKVPSTSFIEDVIKLFLNKSAIKSDSTLRTLITLMTRYNLDTLPNGKDLAVKILHYTFEKETLAKSNLRQIIKTDRPSAHVLARVGTVCCLSKTDVVKFCKANRIDGSKFFETNWNLQKQKLYKSEVQKVIDLILLRSNERLLIEDLDFIGREGGPVNTDLKLDFPTEIKCIVEQSYEELLPQVIDFKSKIVNDDDNFEMVKEYLERVLENNELLMSLANDFLSYEAFNQEKFAASFLVKKIDYHIQEIEQLFGLLLQKNGDHGMQEVHRLILMVKSLFSSKFHAKLCMKIRSYELGNCLKWLGKQVKHKFIDKDDDFFMGVGKSEFENAKMEHKLKFLAIETLCEYNNFEGANTECMIDLLHAIVLDVDDNMDLHTVFHLLTIFGRQSNVSKDIVEWIWPFVAEICQSYNADQYISGRMVGVLQDVVKLSKNHKDMDENVVTLFRSFGTVCARPEFSPEVTISYLRQFRVFHENYFHLYFDNATVIGIYKFIYDDFLNSPLLAIKMAAIKTISFILHSDIEQDTLLSDRESQKKISEIIFRKHHIDYTSEEMETDDGNDERANKIAGHLQLYTSVFCVNFLFRKPLILEISKVILHFKLSVEVAQKLFSKILAFLNCAADSLMDSNSIVHFSSQWIRLLYPLFQFPWYFCGGRSFDEFLQENYELVLVAILKNRCRETEPFAKATELSPKSMIENVLPSCFSFLIPIKAGCSGISYEVKAKEMSDKISTYHTAEEQKVNLIKNMPSVIGNVLENLYDREKFKEFCGFDFEFRGTNENIDCENFDKCLNHLKSNYPGAGNHSIFTFFCATPKYGHSIEKLLTIQKKKIQSTSLKEHKLLYLLQYCVLLEKFFEYLTCATVPSATSIKGYIVRETTTFLCFLLLDEKYGTRLRETSATFLSSLLKKILPVCSNDVKPFLNKIVSSMVTICKKLQSSKNSELYKNCFGIIKFLIIEQQKHLQSEIAKLDEFPDTLEFVELRQKHLGIKYKGGEFTLVQEIEHFLEVKKRKVEGLTALCGKLAEKKSELKQLFNELGASLGFSEDGEKSLLHKLIRSLIDYARNNYDDDERAVIAIKCLGEIGNYDLVTMVFQTEDHQTATIYDRVENVEQCQKMICSQALSQMETMILHYNPRIFEDASRACYYMMESVSSQGYEASVYLRPFKTGATSPRTLFYESPKEGKKLDFVELMRKEEYSTYKTWIKRIAGSIMLFAGDKVLERVSNAQKSFAELMTPLMMQLLLSYNKSSVNEEIMSGINFFFNESAEKLVYLRVNESSIFVNKQAIKQMLKLVECLRMHCQAHPRSKIAQSLQLDYLNIAKSAKHCEAFFTAVLYCEKWAEKRMLTESVPYAASINDPVLQNIMYDSFKAIGINDASELFVNPLTNRSLYLQVSNQHWQNILEHDAAGRSDDCLRLMNDAKLHFLASKLSSADQKSKNYESLWRLADWDVLIPCDPEIKDAKVVVDYRDEFEKCHYSALKCLKNGDELGQKTTVSKARKAILNLLQQESLECTQNLYKFLGMSHMLQQIEDFADIRFYRPIGSSDKLLQKWNAQNQLPHDFKLIEPVLSQRNSVLDTANIRAGKRRWVPGALEDNLLYMVKEAIEAGFRNDALQTLAKMQGMTNLTATSRAEMLVLEAQLHSRSNIGLAKHCLKRVTDDQEFTREFTLKSTAYRMLGEILAENHTDDIKNIDNNFFKQSIKYLQEYAKHQNKAHLVADLVSQPLSQDSQSSLSQVDTEDAIDVKIRSNVCVFETLARYYDRDYISKCEYIESPDFQNKVKTKNINEKKFNELQKAISEGNATRDMGKSSIIYKRSLGIDALEIVTTMKAKKAFAGFALFYYLRSSKNDPGDNVISIFRIVSIWLANMDSKTIMGTLTNGLCNIPTYKFVVALPQLVVRLGDDSSDLLETLIKKCTVDHPHHTLPLVLALVNSYADSDRKPDREEARVVGAKKLWDSLKKNKKISIQTIQQLEKMSTALIELANTEPIQHNLGRLPKLDRIQCPTVDIPVMKDCNYDGVLTSVVGWTEELQKVGGINAPKQIFCKCSDGVTRSQLLKGKDDMRQDAVMQQVFSVVNQLLKNNKEMQKRHARVRTYKVVPLARRSGILEWCENTVPIGVYLAPQARDKIGAHQRYFPKDLRPIECMHELSKCDKKEVDKKAIFQKICDRIHPAFHYFFYENYKNPGQWFERRLAYTTSVAVSSMVGYILGIGDRHVQNILIDYNTAEVIHIDFGIAFEQGRILPHPELIPFRLTRDIVAPMGVCGVDGVFRKACEKTMKILRDNEKTLVTILEILLYDPMYAWTLSTSKARRRQLDDEAAEEGDDGSEQNTQKDSMASRALLRVKAKLKGQADDSSGYSSVEGQVECLIQKAMNTSLLSQLFKGWQAYL